MTLVRASGWFAGGVGAGLEGDVLRLKAGLFPDQVLEDAVDDVEDPGVASEVRGEPVFDAVLGLDHFLDDLQVGGDVGAPEPIDGLLGVPHHEQLAGGEADVAPARGPPRGLLAQPQDDLVLQRIGVLELVHQDGLEARLQFLPDARMVPEQVPRPHQQTVEGHQAMAGEVLAALPGERHQEGAQSVDLPGVHLRERPRVGHEVPCVVEVFLGPVLRGGQATQEAQLFVIDRSAAAAGGLYHPPAHRQRLLDPPLLWVTVDEIGNRILQPAQPLSKDAGRIIRSARALEPVQVHVVGAKGQRQLAEPVQRKAAEDLFPFLGPGPRARQLFVEP